ncbi:MAG: hypothetical protein COV67_14545 [Nitrospinae bacterium CG11_big_fil_rev_8_21_14_0_20_56_8]|nr:MAG: hypothetical protein COV67_14545 [Nitrospinae bacterium CG11_big_fil_rev_8_21_14_0_20_56_8]
MKRREFLKKSAVAGAAGAAAVTLAKPALSQGRKEMIIVSTWPRDFPGLGLSAQRLAARIPVLTDGRIQVKYFASGERVGAFDSFDEVASGNSQAYIGADYYWKGKHPGWAYFTAVPFGFAYAEMDAWMKYGGGQQLHDELAAGFGIKGFPCGNTGCQMGGWFNKEINSAADFKGLKMRIPGLGGDVLAKLGASTVSLPGSQIYENLVSGAIQATEWVGPYNDYFMKFYEAAKFYYYPGMHEPASQLHMGMNKKWWDGLSKTDQAIIEAACKLVKKGQKVSPEIMIPLVAHVNEFTRVRDLIVAEAKDVIDKSEVSLDYKIGTMIELPRAAVTADEIAAKADFFSFGTNDLTQTGFGLSRDDAGRFLPFYLENGLLKEDPFVSLDQKGMGVLIRMAIDKGKPVNPSLHLGVCGEHGGDPKSIDFFHQVGVDYVSCSPFRVPTAHLAAAQAVIRNR